MGRFDEQFKLIHQNIEFAVKGKGEVVELLILALVCGGHVLIEDVPGVGKTTLGKALARSVDVSFGRIQFTPDLLPVDITGTSVFNRATGTFEFRPGPVFSNIVLADEINRASPKAQSALLEAMGEQQVTLDGVTRRLESPFTVIATQNPLEYEGTYPLPESQLDRFLMRLQVGYPDRASEDSILMDRGAQEPVDLIEPVADAAVVRWMSDQLEDVHVSGPLRSYLLEVASATRRHPGLSLGLSPPRGAGRAQGGAGQGRLVEPRLRHARRHQGSGPSHVAAPAPPKAGQPRAGPAVRRHRHRDSRLSARAPQGALRGRAARR